MEFNLGEKFAKLKFRFFRPKDPRPVSVQIQELIQSGQGPPESWGQPTARQREILNKAGGRIPSSGARREMDGGVPRD